MRRGETVWPPSRWRKLYPWMQNLKVAANVVLALAAHVVAAIFVRPYRDLLFSVGDLFPHNHDMAEIPDVLAFGLLVVGVLVGAVAGAAAAFVSKRGAPSSRA